MSDELKLLPCPFCGGEAEIMLDMLNRAKARCSSAECFMHCHVWINVSDWNTRPLEDALSKENARLKARVEAEEELIEAHGAILDAINTSPEHWNDKEKYGDYLYSAAQRLQEARAAWEALK